MNAKSKSSRPTLNASGRNSKVPGKDVSHREPAAASNSRILAKQQTFGHPRPLPRIGTSISGLPEELLMRIFKLLDISTLLQVDRVCKRWHRIASDNSLWQDVYQQYVGGGSAPPPPPPPPSLGASSASLSSAATSAAAGSEGHYGISYWKQLCFQCWYKRRNKLTLSVGKKQKLNPFTGLPQNTELILKKINIHFQLELYESTEHNRAPLARVDSRGIFWHSMAACVRWYSLDSLPRDPVRKIRILASGPLIPSPDPSNVTADPQHRSLLMEVNAPLGTFLRRETPIASDEHVNVFRLPGDVLLATWKADQSIAFFCLGLHFHNLVQRCILGSPAEFCRPFMHKVIPDDIDRTYGLHDYSCTVEVRNMRYSAWSQRYSGLHCPLEALCDGFAELVVIRRDMPVDHVIFSRELNLPWKTDLFHGHISNLVYLDCTLLDERGEVFWAKSVAVQTEPPDSSKDGPDPQSGSFDYNYEHETIRVIRYNADPRVHVLIDLGKMSDGRLFITSLKLRLNVQAINAWFGTAY